MTVSTLGVTLDDMRVVVGSVENIEVEEEREDVGVEDETGVAAPALVANVAEETAVAMEEVEDRRLDTDELLTDATGIEETEAASSKVSVEMRTNERRFEGDFDEDG